MSESEIITLLSSDEEENIVPKKRIKLCPVPLSKPGSSEKPITSTQIQEPCIVLSDEDDSELMASSSTPVIVATNSKEDFSNIAVVLEKDSDANTNSDESGISELCKRFLKVCIDNIKVSNQRIVVMEKLQFMKDAFDKYIHLTCDYNLLQKNLEFNLDVMKAQPTRSIICFGDMYHFIKLKLHDEMQAKEALSDKRKIIKKLERFLAKLKNRIDKLENSICDFDADGDSSYIQVGLYKARAAKIHAKICQFRKLNPHAGRIAYQRINFTQSKYAIINEAINKKYKNVFAFPRFHEIEQIVQQCVKENNTLIMNDLDIKVEAKCCFEKLGNFIQQRRQLDLYSLHCDYLDDFNDDPARDNPALQGKLLDSYKTKVEKESELFNKFSEMQEKGVKCDETEEDSCASSESELEDETRIVNENDGSGANGNERSSIDCILVD